MGHPRLEWTSQCTGVLAFEALGWTTASCWYDESLDPLRNSCGCCFQLSQYAGEGVAASTAKG